MRLRGNHEPTFPPARFSQARRQPKLSLLTDKGRLAGLPAPSPRLRVQTLGPCRVWHDDQECFLSQAAVITHKEVLFAWLASQPEHAISCLTAASAFWPDSAPANGRRNLLMLVKQLNQALGGGRYIEPHGDLILLRPTPWHDADHFVAAAQTALAGADPNAHRAALALYSGPFLPGWEQPWAQERRRTIDGLWTQLHLRLADLTIQDGRDDLADLQLGAALHQHPSCQTLLHKLLTAIRQKAHGFQPWDECWAFSRVSAWFARRCSVGWSRWRRSPRWRRNSCGSTYWASGAGGGTRRAEHVRWIP